MIQARCGALDEIAFGLNRGANKKAPHRGAFGSCRAAAYLAVVFLATTFFAGALDTALVAVFFAATGALGAPVALVATCERALP